MTIRIVRDVAVPTIPPALGGIVIAVDLPVSTVIVTVSITNRMRIVQYAPRIRGVERSARSVPIGAVWKSFVEVIAIAAVPTALFGVQNVVTATVSDIIEIFIRAFPEDELNSVRNGQVTIGIVLDRSTERCRASVVRTGPACEKQQQGQDKWARGCEQILHASSERVSYC